MRQISKVLFAAAVVALAGAPSYAQKPEWVSPVPDIEGDPANGRAKSESCATCHGEEGFSTHNYFPVLAGQTEEYLLFQLHYYRSGKRFHPLMTPLTKDLTDQDIADLSAFYASIPIARAADPVAASLKE